MNNLSLLHTQMGQSPWLDNLSRDMVVDGSLQKLIDDGIRGMTSNPSIFEKAILNGEHYNEQIKQVVGNGGSAEDAYWALAKDDIRSCAKLLKPVYDESKGTDGFVSIEVSPRLAHDTEGTIKQARELWSDLNLRNVMIKIPATAEGIPAIEQCLSEGININITLLFGLDRYHDVINAYKSAVRKAPSVKSVASFFISRIDTEADNRLTTIGTAEALALRGKVAVAQGLCAYDIFQKAFPGVNDDAHIQRLLWASTSTKNPDYDDLLYVRNLIAKHTINTLPNSTIDAIQALVNPLDQSITTEAVTNAHKVANQALEAGIDINDICQKLEDEGVDKFNKAFDTLLQAIEDKAKA